MVVNSVEDSFKNGWLIVSLKKKPQTASSDIFFSCNFLF